MSKTLEDKEQLYRKSLYINGSTAQIKMMIEECGELIVALSHYERQMVEKNAVLTELADVSIMVEQMAIHFGQEGFEVQKAYKLNRLKKRLEKDRKET